MSRNTHHRQRDHEGTDLTSNVVLDGAIGAFTSGSNLHTGILTALGSGSGINLILNEGGNPLSTGIKGVFVVPYNGEITQYTMLADQTGSIVIDLWKDTYANYPPTDADSIAGAGTPPTISSAIKSQDSTLTSWTKTFSAGDIFMVNIDSATTVTWVTLELRIRRT